MRTTLLFVLVAALGVAAGAGTAVLQLAATPWNGDPGGKGDHPLPHDLGKPGDPMPKVVVDSQQFDFGVMDMDASASHDFRFTNAGQAALTLEPGPTTCQCTGIGLEKKQVAPGESANVTVKWTAREVSGPYSQNAVVFCNDPERPRVTLTITGQVKKALMAVPPEIVFSRVSLNEPSTAEVAVYCYLAKPLKILGMVLSDREIADKFEVTYSPLPPDRLAQEPEAKSGCLIRATVKPGLPLGAFRQTILLRTNLDSAPALDVPIRGTVGGDIAVFGRGWSEGTRVLTIGAVKGQAGAKRQLMLVVRGSRAGRVKFKVGHVSPEVLHVSLGQTTETSGGNLSQTPLIIEIPKDSQPVNCLGTDTQELGQIVIETDHPDVPELQVSVRFAVEG